VNTFGGRIKEARIKKELTQRQLADMIGAKHNSVSDWENDKNKPDPDTIELILGALDITANDLFGWDNPEQLKADAEELADKIISNDKVKNILPLLINLSDNDLELVTNFVQRLIGETK
jgi:transcriptional regulator with XRE-family HTH domain